MDPSALPTGLQMEPERLENTATSATFSMPSGVAQTSCATGLRLQLSRDEWDALKPLIRRLYIEENRTFLSIQNVLAESHNFRPTKKQFTVKINEWDFKKNLKRGEREELLRAVGPVEGEIIIDLTGRKHKKQKLLRWESEMKKESFGAPSCHPPTLSYRGSQAMDGIANSEVFSEPTASTEATPVMPESVVDKEINLDREANPVERERKIWVKDDEEYKYYPHARWMNADVLNSPTLTRLFEGLAIETKGLPNDIEELILPARSLENYTTTAPEIVTWSQLTAQSCNENALVIPLADEKTHFPDPENCLGVTFPGQKLALSRLKPDKFRIFDALLPSGAQVKTMPSPFNELYPFSTSSHRTQRPRSSITMMKSLQHDVNECSNKIALLKRAGVHESHPALLKAMKSLADDFYLQGNFRQAETFYRKVLAAQQGGPETWSFLGFEAQIRFIDSICRQGNAVAAMALLEGFSVTVARIFEPTDPVFRELLSTKITVLQMINNYEAREAVCRDLLQICLVHLGPKHPGTLDALFRLSYAAMNRKRYIESEKLQRFVLQLLQDGQDMEYEYQNKCWSLSNLGDVLERKNRLDEAIKLHRASSQLAKEKLGDKDLTTISSNSGLGRALRLKGLLQESEELLEIAAELKIKLHGEDHSDSLWTMYELGRTLYERRNYEEGSTWFQRCFRINLTLPQLNYELTKYSCDYLGRCFEKQRRYMDASAVYQEASDFFRAAKENHQVDNARLQRWVSRLQRWSDEARQHATTYSNPNSEILELE